MAGELLIDDPVDGVRRLMISNPAKRNALDHVILDAIAAAVASAERDGDVRCLVISGAHGMFSSGYDIGEPPNSHDDTTTDAFAERAAGLVAHPFTSAIDALYATNLPTVAALPGHTIGGGLELALACDLRLARDGIRLGMPPAKLGLVYSHTGLRRFLQAIGEPRTRELFLLGRQIDARTAEQWGLVNAVLGEEDLEVTALDWARELADNAPLSIQGNKQILRELLRADVTLDPAVEAQLLALREACFASKDLREGVRAFSAKRPPRWRGR